MPRYFFNTTDGVRVRDIEGVVLEDVEVARIQAIRFLGELLAETPNLLAGEDDFKVEVTDHGGSMVCVVLARTLDPSVIKKP